jgi:hypothetical protein
LSEEAEALHRISVTGKNAGKAYDLFLEAFLKREREDVSDLIFDPDLKDTEIVQLRARGLVLKNIEAEIKTSIFAGKEANKKLLLQND